MSCIHRYNPAIEEQVTAFYQSLSEKDRRRYAAIEACKLGRGGLSYMVRVLKYDRHTIAQGVQELADGTELQRSRIRRTGGGREHSQEVIPGLDAAFLQVLEHHTAGSPVNAGVVIPHGIYDVQRNHGYVTLGTSHDTSAFACDCLPHWWQHYGQPTYAAADSLLVLCDGGGSNGVRTYLFKHDLEQLAQVLGIEIRVAHSPPYTFKYNPIEHRLFPHLTRAGQGVIFTSVELVKNLMANTTTKTGLTVDVSVLDKV